MKMLKPTRCDFGSETVETVAHNKESVLLLFYGMGKREVVSLRKEFYTKAFLRNSVNAWAIGLSIEKIIEKAEEMSKKNYYL